MRSLSLCLLCLLSACDDYLLLVPEGSGSAARSAGILALTADAPSGEAVFVSHCAVCHDKTGAEQKVGPALAELISGSDDAETVATILDGRGSMPAQSIPDDQDVADLLAWMHGEWP